MELHTEEHKSYHWECYKTKAQPTKNEIEFVIETIRKFLQNINGGMSLELSCNDDDNSDSPFVHKYNLSIHGVESYYGTEVYES